MKKFFILIMALSITVAGYAADIKVKRGLDATAPAALPMGEPAMTTDSHRVFFGTGTGKKELLDKAAFDSYTTLNRITLEEADARYKSKLAFSTYSANRAAKDLAQDSATTAAAAVAASALQPLGVTAGTITDTDTIAFARSGGFLSSAWSGIKTALRSAFDTVYATAAQGVKADKARPVYNVVNYGATGDGLTDDSVAVQAASTAAPYGAVIYLPKPSVAYKFSNVLLKRGQTLEADPAESSTSLLVGTWVYVTDTVNPCLKMPSETGVKGVNFYYPDQKKTLTDWTQAPGDNESPTVYPPTIKVQPHAASVTLSKINFANSYIAVDADSASTGSHAYLTMVDVRGYPLYRGVVDDWSVDIDRFERVHFNANNSVDVWGGANQIQDSIHKWVALNGTGFEIMRADWPRLINCFTYGYNKGVDFRDNPEGLGAGEATVLASGFDSTRIGVDISGSAWGIKVLGSDFAPFDRLDTAFLAGTAIRANFTKDLTVDNLLMWSPYSSKALDIIQAGDVSVSALHVKEYGQYATTANPFASIGTVGSFSLSGGFADGASDAYSQGISISGTAKNVKLDNFEFKNIVGAPLLIANGADGVFVDASVTYTNTGTISDSSTTANKSIITGTVYTLGSPGSDSKLATEKSIRTAISAAVAAAGGGDVVGPASAVDNHLVAFNGTTGKVIKDGPAYGTGASELLQIRSDGKLPAIDGSLLTNLPGGTGTFTPAGTVTGALQARDSAGTGLIADDSILLDTTNHRLGVGIAPGAIIHSYTQDASSGASVLLKLEHAHSSTAANNIGTQIGFFNENAAGTSVNSGSIISRLSDVTNNYGNLEFYVNSGAGIYKAASLDSTSKYSIIGANPNLMLSHTSQGALQMYHSGYTVDQKWLEWLQQNDGKMLMRFINDAYNSSSAIMEAKRVAGSHTVEYVAFPIGNVGIGNVAPSEKLDVTGNIKATAYILAGYEEKTASYTVSKDASKITLASGTATVTLPKTLPANSEVNAGITVAGAAASGVSFAVESGGSISWGDAGAPTFTNNKTADVVCKSQNVAATTTATWRCTKGGNF